MPDQSNPRIDRRLLLAAIALAAGFLWLDHRINQLEGRAAMDDFEACVLTGNC